MPMQASLSQDTGSVPPHVGYRLSEALIVLGRWPEIHFGELDPARERCDAGR
ncbi:hypothetical protein [Sinorhizobium medicae]|uniref:hypothetical protein n=1 Tax=Sinorhizobium medicae TaxID=110321 RepID=UPI001295DC79|nr:hypothetical protein [Sinorhizobium medicae]MQX46015.1 hypothetical protein [Sinorhizobium medicae]